MSRCFGSMQWNACVHRLDLSLYSVFNEFLGNGVRTYVNSKGKIPSAGKKVLPRGGSNPRCCIMLHSEPNTLPTSYSGPFTLTNPFLQVNPRVGEAELFMVRLPRAPQTAVSGGARLTSDNMGVTIEPAGVLRFMPDSLLPQVSEMAGQVRNTPFFLIWHSLM